MHFCHQTKYAAHASSTFRRGDARAGEGGKCERERESETLSLVCVGTRLFTHMRLWGSNGDFDFLALVSSLISITV